MVKCIRVNLINLKMNFIFVFKTLPSVLDNGIVTKTFTLIDTPYFNGDLCEIMVFLK